MRSGTLNVPGIVGLGKACEIAKQEMPQESCHIAGLRNRLQQKIKAGVDEVFVNGSVEQRLPGNLNLSFAGVDGEELMTAIDDVAVSSGAACTSAHIEPSYVLKALGISDELAQSSIRFGIGRFNTEAEIDYVAAKVIHAVRSLRELPVKTLRFRTALALRNLLLKCDADPDLKLFGIEVLPHNRRFWLFHTRLAQKFRSLFRRCGIDIEPRAPLESTNLGQFGHELDMPVVVVVA